MIFYSKYRTLMYGLVQSFHVFLGFPRPCARNFSFQSSYDTYILNLTKRDEDLVKHCFVFVDFIYINDPGYLIYLPALFGGAVKFAPYPQFQWNDAVGYGETEPKQTTKTQTKLKRCAKLVAYIYLAPEIPPSLLFQLFIFIYSTLNHIQYACGQTIQCLTTKHKSHVMHFIWFTVSPYL